MENSIKFLENSLLYQMSLGSKELYHSNVWAWLIEKDPAFISAFFKEVDLFRQFIDYMYKEGKTKSNVENVLKLIAAQDKTDIKIEKKKG